MKQNHQTGFSLVAAIFLLVILSGLVGYLINLTAVQQNTVVMGLQGARANLAARSAVEYLAYQVLQDATYCASNPTGTLQFTSSEPALERFEVDWTCAESTHTEGVSPDGDMTVYRLTATATLQNVSYVYSTGSSNPDYIQRKISASVSKPPG